MVIETSEALQHWLKESEHIFEDAEILSFEMGSSAPAGHPTDATLDLGVPLSGSWKAGESKTLAVYRFHLTRIVAWELSGNVVPGHCSEGIDVLDDLSFVASPSTSRRYCKSTVSGMRSADFRTGPDSSRPI